MTWSPFCSPSVPVLEGSTVLCSKCFCADQRKSREKSLKKELLALRRQIQKERRSRGSGENSDCDDIEQVEACLSVAA